MSRTVSRAILVTIFAVWLLAIGFLVAFAEGIIPKTPRQVLILLVVIGPLLLFGEAIYEAVFQLVGYAVGRVVLPIVTFGWLRSEGPKDVLSFPWHGITRGTDGRYVVSADATAVLGLVILVLAMITSALIYAVST